VHAGLRLPKSHYPSCIFAARTSTLVCSLSIRDVSTGHVVSKQ
jgi:hypothetical protein